MDARLDRDTLSFSDRLPVRTLVESTRGASLRLVILDASQRIPEVPSMDPASNRPSLSPGSFGELDQDLLERGVLVAYSATAGATAPRVTTRNSPYTAALVAYLQQPLEIRVLLRDVGARVLRDTRGQQQPEQYHRLLDEYYLAGWPGVTPLTTHTLLSSAATLSPRQLRAFAEQGNARAQTQLGWRHVRRSCATAVAWFRRAADQGHPAAQAALGYMHLEGNRLCAGSGAYTTVTREGFPIGRGFEPVDHGDFAPQGPEAAAALFHDAAPWDSDAQYFLGTMYRDGMAVAPDASIAAELFQRAARGGDTAAQAALGECYERGVGVEQSYENALVWYRSAVEQNSRDGRTRTRARARIETAFGTAAQAAYDARAGIGYLYYVGRGTDRDEVLAIGHLREAACCSARAQYYLGLAYRDGRGVEHDDSVAAGWFRRAADRGYEEAERQLVAIAERPAGVEFRSAVLVLQLASVVALLIGGLLALIQWLMPDADGVHREKLGAGLKALNATRPFDLGVLVLQRAVKRVHSLFARPVLTYAVVIGLGALANVLVPGVALAVVVWKNAEGGFGDDFTGWQFIAEIVKVHGGSLAGAVWIVAVLGSIFDGVSLGVTYHLLRRAARASTVRGLLALLALDLLVAAIAWVWAYATFALALRLYYDELAATVGLFGCVECYIQKTVVGTLRANWGVGIPIVGLGVSAAIPTMLYGAVLWTIVGLRVTPKWIQTFLVKIVSALTRDGRPVLVQLKAGFMYMFVLMGALSVAMQALAKVAT